MNIPERYQDLFKDETKAYLFLATIMDDGTPQVTPVWFNTDGEHILINTSVGRVKDRNIQARPDVALCILDLNEPYHYIQVRGKVVERTTEGADEHINTLSQIYDGKDWSASPNQTRVIYKISVDKISGY